MIQLRLIRAQPAAPTGFTDLPVRTKAEEQIGDAQLLPSSSMDIAYGALIDLVDFVKAEYIIPLGAIVLATPAGSKYALLARGEGLA